jgi:PadR family transcriptional regulator, regulatory protein PadR
LLLVRYLFIIHDVMSRSTLTDFELMILLAILRIGEDAYGVPIAREIEATGRRTVAIAAVYAALERLEERGLVSSSLGDPTPERGGRAKKFFQATGAGVRLVREAHEGLTAMWRGLSVLKGRA